MSKKLNLIFSILSLVTTTILLIVTVYSWYTQNEVVTVTSIVAQTESETTHYDLYYWDANDPTPSWKTVTEIRKTNVLPGTTTYFKLKCVNSGTSAVKLTAKFQGIQSRLDTNYVKVSRDGKYITYNGIKTYDIVNNQVKVEPVIDGLDTKDILYTISGSTIGLRHFEIKNGYAIQKFGTTETHSDAILKRDDITSLSNISLNIADPILNNQTISVGENNFYFALTFLDDDDQDKYFMYQELYIDSLTMFEDN